MNTSLIHLKTIDSTNSYALLNFSSLNNSTLIFADEQTEGKGRRGKKWISPPGNLYASFIFKNRTVSQFHLVCIAGLATLDTIRDFAKPDSRNTFKIKWPNDIFCGFRKISGTLCEMHKIQGSNKSDGAVIGIGVNLNMKKDVFEKIDRPATSLFELNSEEIQVRHFAEILQKKLVKYSKFAEDDWNGLFYAWKDENFLRGTEVEFSHEAKEKIVGTVANIEPDGKIVIISGERKHRFLSGDVHLISQC